MFTFTSISPWLVEEETLKLALASFSRPAVRSSKLPLGKASFFPARKMKPEKKKKMNCSNSECAVIQNFHPLSPQTSSAE